MTVRILVVEDDPDDEAVLRSLLEQSERPISVACERLLTPALQRLAREPFSLVFLDLSLPDSWGLETLRRLRKGSPAVPVVLMTGAVLPGLAAEAVAKGHWPVSSSTSWMGRGCRTFWIAFAETCKDRPRRGVRNRDCVWTIRLVIWGGWPRSRGFATLRSVHNCGPMAWICHFWTTRQFGAWQGEIIDEFDSRG